MKKRWKEIAVLTVQTLVFYLVPLFSKAIGPIGMVMILISLTFLLAVVAGNVAQGKFKYLYAILVALIFIPSVFIYYNTSALIHSLWYLVIAFIGQSIGDWIHHRTQDH